MSLGLDRIGVVVLAAGLSRRYGAQNKLLRMVDGESMVRRVISLFDRLGFGTLLAVVGHDADLVEGELAGLQVATVFNPLFNDGMGGSVAVGIKAISNYDVDGALICVADLPGLNAACVRSVCEAFRAAGSQRVAIPCFAGERGHPVCIPKRLFGELMKLSGESGAKQTIAADVFEPVFVEQDDSGCILDVDTD